MSALCSISRRAVCCFSPDRKSTRLNSSHSQISYAVFCLKKKTHEDRTVKVVAKVASRPLRVDAELEAQIEGVSRFAAERMKRPYADFWQSITKQATVHDE